MKIVSYNPAKRVEGSILNGNISDLPLTENIYFLTFKNEVEKSLYKNKRTKEYMTIYEFKPYDILYILKEYMSYGSINNKNPFVITKSDLNFNKIVFFGNDIKIMSICPDKTNFILVETKTELPFFNKENRVLMSINNFNEKFINNEKKVFYLDGPYFIDENNSQLDTILE